MKRIAQALMIVSMIAAGSSAVWAAPSEPLKLVPAVDLQRYLGRWYEIARYQHSFEKNLVGATAEYSLRPDGKVTVLNSGFQKTLDGAYKEARAVAWVPNPAVSSALKVMFFWPFAGDYLVFGLDEQNYSWALVGSNSRKYLWFLARTPEVSPEVLAKMKEITASQGYDLSKLYMVPQKAR